MSTEVDRLMCPKCGSTNLMFSDENENIRSVTKELNYSCKNCGNQHWCAICGKHVNVCHSLGFGQCCDFMWWGFAGFFTPSNGDSSFTEYEPIQYE